MIDLREAKREDLELLYAMQLRAFSTLYEKYQDKETSPAAEPFERTLQRFSDSNITYYLIFEDESIIGSIRIRKENKTYVLVQIIILPEYQNKGFAQLAIRKIESLYPDAEYWRLDTIAQEDKLCHLYSKMGYQKTGEVEHIKEGLDIVFFEKQVNKSAKEKYPTREEAESLLKEAESCNPGPWGDHSRIAAHCAEVIAAKSGMNAEKAYVLGLLHDIGRKFGKRHLGHVSDGYSYMMSLGYDDVARICLTHSFNQKDISKYIGKFDTTEEETKLIVDGLNALELDDYDRLIQLCDSIAGAEGIMDQTDRMMDVKNRYGYYDQEKWDTNIMLREYFERKMGEDLYVVLQR